MKNNHKIDVIIPAYNVADDILYRCLASIACQTIIKDIKVTIVDDGSTKQNYKSIAALFEPMLKINILKCKINEGPGMARQYGYDNTYGEFVTFIDADDTFYTPFSLKALHMGIEMDGGYAACIGNFLEENNGNFLPHQQDMIWMFGKLYRRNFIDKYKIRFCPGSRWNEDNGFNTCMRLCINEKERINFITDTVYCWHEQENSITRAENCRYSYDKSFVGFAENMIWAVKHGYKMAPFNGMIDQWAITSFLNLYEYLLEAYGRDKRFLRQAWAWTQAYYDNIIVPIKNKMTDEVVQAIYSDVMRNAYGRGSMIGIIPFISLEEFFKKLENHEDIEYDVNDISDYFPSDSQWLENGVYI